MSASIPLLESVRIDYTQQVLCIYYLKLTHRQTCPSLKLLARGKVRDLYDIDEHSLLFVATDRISAYDCIMKTVYFPLADHWVVLRISSERY